MYNFISVSLLPFRFFLHSFLRLRRHLPNLCPHFFIHSHNFCISRHHHLLFFRITFFDLKGNRNLQYYHLSSSLFFMLFSVFIFIIIFSPHTLFIIFFAVVFLITFTFLFHCHFFPFFPSDSSFTPHTFFLTVISACFFFLFTCFFCHYRSSCFFFFHFILTSFIQYKCLEEQ